MFSKIAFAAALVAVANAGQAEDAVDTFKQQAQTTSFSAKLAARLAAAAVNQGMLKDGIETAVSSINRVTALGSTMTEAQDTVDALKNSHPKKVDDAMDDLAAKLTAAADDLHDELAEQLAELTQAVKDQKDDADAIIKEGTDLNDKTQKEITDAQEKMVDTLDEMAKCAAKQGVYDVDGDKCVIPELDDTSYMDIVTHNLWTNQDSRERGYLNSRDLVFTKHYDNTYMRIMYYDNVRCHGHTSHGKWEVYICDSGGGGCAPCRDPGRLQHYRWSGHQHGWWMNDHTGGTIFGLCKATDNRALTKGTYKLRLYLHDNRYDLHTGHHGSHGSFTVDEVMKY